MKLLSKHHLLQVARQRRQRSVARMGAAAFALAGSSVAMAATASDPFNDFLTMVETWATGALGAGLSITMMIIGIGTGIARNSAMPALSGIAAAAILNFGPGIIKALLTGALI